MYCLGRRVTQVARHLADLVRSSLRRLEPESVPKANGATGEMIGAGRGTRTPDTRFRRPMLYPLSYTRSNTSEDTLIERRMSSGVVVSHESPLEDDDLQTTLNLNPHFFLRTAGMRGIMRSRRVIPLKGADIACR